MIADSAVADAPRRINKIVVLGGGSAGFLVALALRKRLPNLQIEVVRSLKLGVIGVGEATVVGVVNFLHNFLELEPRSFHNGARPALKLGIHFLWGPRPSFNYPFTLELARADERMKLPRGYYCQEQDDFVGVTSCLMHHGKACLRGAHGQPALRRGFAYHLENRLFVDYLEGVADEFGLPKIDGILQHAEVDEQGVRAIVLESGQRIEADLFVDCSGFRSELLGKALAEPFLSFGNALFNDRAIVGGWERGADDVFKPYTTAETMNAGWCWRIDHDTVINRGYVHSSAFLSAEEAEREFREKNPKIKETGIVQFRTGLYRRTFVKNVVAMGNSAGFVEPLESTSLSMICDGAVLLCQALQASDGWLLPSQREVYNQHVEYHWITIRDFLALHFRFNRRYDTPYWRACLADAELGTVEPLVDYYQEVGPDLSMFESHMRRNIFTLEGYLALLVGQAVPYRRRPELRPEDVATWQEHRKHLQSLVRDALTVEELLAHWRGRGMEGYRSTPGNREPIMPSDMGQLAWM